MNFVTIPGLEAIKAKLVAAVKEGQVAHAQLFYGRQGALNLPMALAFAQFLHCEARGESDSCGQCGSCQLSKKYIHPDTHFAYPVGNMKSVLDEDDPAALRSELLKMWRQFLIENPFGSASAWTLHYGGEDKQPIITREEGREIIKALALKSFQSKYKVMIIWQPETMHSSASNGLLKILEEPPANTVFLLVSNRKEQLMPTILSRTQAINIATLSDEEVEQWLLDLKVEPTKARTLASLAEGDLELAAHLMSENDPQHHEVFSTWMRHCFKSDFNALVSMADAFHEKDRQHQRSFIQYALGMMRETLLAVQGASQLHRTRGNERTFVEKFKSVFSLPKVEQFYYLLNDSAMHLERNGSAKMIFIDLSMQFSKAFRGA